MSRSTRWYAPDGGRAAAGRRSLGTALVAGACLVLPAALSATAAGAESPLPAPVDAYLTGARQAGVGRLTWMGFHVYDARLFVAVPGEPSGASSGGPSSGSEGAERDLLRERFVLELTYARKLRGDAIAQTSHDEIERLGFGDDARRARWLTRMRAIFADVERNTRLAGVHLPGSGARFYRDGRFAGAIDDAEFATAFFSIWLDQRTREPALRAQLIGARAR